MNFHIHSLFFVKARALLIFWLSPHFISSGSESQTRSFESSLLYQLHICWWSCIRALWFVFDNSRLLQFFSLLARSTSALNFVKETPCFQTHNLWFCWCSKSYSQILTPSDSSLSHFLEPWFGFSFPNLTISIEDFDFQLSSFWGWFIFWPIPHEVFTIIVSKLPLDFNPVRFLSSVHYFPQFACILKAPFITLSFYWPHIDISESLI